VKFEPKKAMLPVTKIAIGPYEKFGNRHSTVTHSGTKGTCFLELSLFPHVV
jgi:hypothetical protein